MKPDLDPHVRDAWAATSYAPLDADPRFQSDTQMASLRTHHDTMAQRTRDLYAGHQIDDSTPWDGIHAWAAFIAIVLVLIVCAAIGVWGALSVRGH